MINFVQHVLNPAWYHGHDKRAPYFEGWYFKLINHAENQRWAFIPGVFLNKDTQASHAFVQVLNGMTGEATYHHYDLAQFRAQRNAFDVQIGRNNFQLEQITLDIDDEHGQITGDLYFDVQQGWPVNLLNSGVMGSLGWLPFLECYHGILSFDHAITGCLAINGEQIDFSGGRGYIEKDWGRSFPTAYIWQQTNHFDTPDTCLTGAVAVVPNLGLQMPGVAVGFWHNDKLYPFTTYNRTVLDRIHVTDTHVEWIMHTQHHELCVHSERAKGGLLLGPEREDMHKRVDETLQATATVELYELFGPRRSLIFKGQGRNAGLEVVGDMKLVQTS